ncbi:hypothetical protein [Aestuariivirga sp.]|uniref:hypothetical protein n=1 Tax=Aestuariivirga sp. TaxID=2650926 RepID=UPI003918A074
MAPRGTLFMYRSLKTRGLFCFSPQEKGGGLPESLAPWRAFGVVRPGEAPPHGLSRTEIETGIGEHGFQLWRRKKPKDRSTTSHSNS